jgi:hypothetical protein
MPEVAGSHWEGAGWASGAGEGEVSMRLCAAYALRARTRVALTSPASTQHGAHNSMGRDRHHRHHQALDLAQNGQGR